MKVEVFKLDSTATTPTRNNSGDAGLDLYSLEDIHIPKGQTQLIKTGVAVKVPDGYVGLLRERSSIGKAGLKLAGGVIDAGYSGDISILLMNISNTSNSAMDHPFGYRVRKGDRIAQLILVPVITPEVEVVKKLWDSKRGKNSFGSSGR